MKLLMITRKVDRTEHLAGFIYQWVKKLGEKVDELRVISWQEGDSSGLPGNIKVYHLPTKKNLLFKIAKLKILVWKNAKDVDGIFFHQNPEYVLATACLAKTFRKKLVFWYAHGSVSWRLRLATKLVNVIVSSSSDGFRLPSKKLVVVGQGIDTDKFKPGANRNDGVLRLISIGRISPTKDYESMIKAVDILVNEGMTDLSLNIIGQPGLSKHRSYFESLQTMVSKMNLGDQVKFLGSVPNEEIVPHLQAADIFLNLSSTGSLDKAVLEAMSCGCLPLTSNAAFNKILPQTLLVTKDNPKLLADQIKMVSQLPLTEISRLKNAVRAEVINHHNLDNLMNKIVAQFP